ncbi:hypothetical protein ACFYQ5_03790 [Streptomyces sp. NPDC005794]|uniref:hypothetical protein n=1 Tax=Streptomyces sp. NPDC005794 TaxID=3364733 RepID=UPI00369F04FD
MTEAEPETRRVLLKADPLYDEGVGIARIARIASQLPSGQLRSQPLLSFPPSG